jgi:hypothetical protein
MALRSAAHGAMSQPQPHAEPRFDRWAPSLLWAGFLTFVVAGSWLLPGYLFGTDWPGPRHFAPPSTLESSAPLRALLAAFGWVIGGEATGKLLALGSLFVAGASAYTALPTSGFMPRAIAATVYVLNPFVYGRLHYGQLFLLAAYAVLPWALTRIRRLLLEPSARSSAGVAAAFFLVGVLSPQVLLMAGLLAVVVGASYLVTRNNKASYLSELGPWIAAAVVAVIVASSFWIVPLIAGRGYEGSVIITSGSGELAAYAAIPDQSLGLIPNLLGLYGFWAENSGRFTSMKAFAPIWPVVMLVILVIAAIGAAAAIMRRSQQLAEWITGLLVVGAIALVLEAGISDPATAGLVRWLDAHFLLYRGMRDAGKWAVILGLVYSQLLGLGAATVLTTVRHRFPDPIKAEWAVGIAGAVLLALPLYYGNGLLFGAHGEIKPSPYPAGWYAVDRVLASDPHPNRTLFLPWHEYMSYSFVLNQNRVVAPPAPSFFSVPVLVSANPEVPGVEPPHSPDQDAITALVREGSSGQWAQVLNTYHVKYVLLAKELDWTYFKFLDNQAGLSKVGDFGSMILYRNDLVS